MMKDEHNSIDATVFEKQKRAPEFFSHFLNQITGDSNLCGVDGNTLKVIIVAMASGVQLPGGLHLERTAIENGCGCRFYYFRPTVVGPNDVPDDVEKLLKHAGAQRFIFSSPIRFRELVAEMTADIAAASSNITTH